MMSEVRQYRMLASKLESRDTEIAALKAETEQSREWVKAFALSLHRNYYQKSKPDFQPAEDIPGAITQINTMVVGIEQELQALKAKLAQFREALAEAKECIHIFHGNTAWDIYDTQSPEMQRINALLQETKGATDENL